MSSAEVEGADSSDRDAEQAARSSIIGSSVRPAADAIR
jgi:hypothetical protein